MRRLLLIAVLFALVPVADAQACSCVGPDELLPRADVFVGTVVERGERSYTFAVERVHRGSFPARVTLKSYGSDGASCGIDLPVGRRTGVMVLEPDQPVGLCNMVDPERLEGDGEPPVAPRPAVGGGVLAGLLSGCGDAMRAIFFTLRSLAQV